jgi:hypothetical protein
VFAGACADLPQKERLRNVVPAHKPPTRISDERATVVRNSESHPRIARIDRRVAHAGVDDQPSYLASGNASDTDRTINALI